MSLPFKTEKYDVEYDLQTIEELNLIIKALQEKLFELQNNNKD
tara:strand:+ start:934 stop:1062 length:129 start_codon:yes stop_codon:yes gene_type:complete